MTASPSAPRRKRRSSSTVAAFVFGLPLSLAILATITFAPGVDEKVKRYVHHPVEKVAVVMFCCAVCALGAKLRQSRAERRAFAVPLLPVWDGKTIPIAGAEQLLAGLHRQPKGVQDTLLGKRFHAVLDFLCSRGSANELDDHLRTVADNDALTQENSYSLIRFITWAIPRGE